MGTNTHLCGAQYTSYSDGLQEGFSFWGELSAHQVAGGS